jgi:hypothetical protein
MDTENSTFLYKEKIENLKQAIFYIYDEAGNRVAVSLIEISSIDDQSNILFHLARLPLNTDSEFFVGELAFYKKGTPYYIVAYGTAIIESLEPAILKFNVNFVEHHAVGEGESITEFMKKLPVIKYLTSFNHHHQTKTNLKMG